MLSDFQKKVITCLVREDDGPYTTTEMRMKSILVIYGQEGLEYATSLLKKEKPDVVGRTGAETHGSTETSK